jgi:hypothetical protein
MTRQDDLYQPKPEHKFSFGLWTVGTAAVIRLAISFDHPFRRSRLFVCLRKLGPGESSFTTMT